MSTHTTSDFLTAAEIKLIRNGFAHTVDNGYSKLDGAAAILRSMAVGIERARRELDFVTRHSFPSMVADAECHIRADEALLCNLAARAGA